MRTRIFTVAIGVTFLALCGWFVRAAGPDQKFEEGLSALRANQPEETRYCLTAIEHRPDYHAQASLLRGWLRLQSHQAHEAEDYMLIWADLNDALEVRKCRPLTMALMGRLLCEGGRFANALELLQGALAEDPDEVEAHRWLGSALYDAGAMVPAVEHLKRVADQEVANSQVCRLLGLIYREGGAYREAAAAYEKSLARNPNQPDADRVRLDLAHCHIAMQDYDAALTALVDCADSADVLAVRGLCYFNEGNRERAKQCVLRALKEDSENIAAVECLAMLDPAAAVKPLSQAVEKNPNQEKLRERLVAAYRATGQEELAAENERRLDDIRKLQTELASLLLQANSNLFDVALRYHIADVAESLGRTEMANNWRKAASMLNAPRDAPPPPSVVPPLANEVAHP